MNRKLYVLGTGGFAKEVAQVAAFINEEGPRRWSAIEYLAESDSEIGAPMPFGAVTATDSILTTLTAGADVAIGVGNPAARRKIAARLLPLPHVATPNLIHPSAGFDSRFVKIGRGNIVTRGSIFTCDIEVLDFNVFNLNCTIGHDARIGSFNVVNPGCNISGGVSLGDACLLGTGCQILEGLSVVSEVTIGGGAVVARSIDAPGVYVGVPAKAMK